jgi:hypothetical protein
MKLKRLIYALPWCALVFMLAASGCGSDGGDDTPPAPDVQALLTSGAWKVKSVTVDGLNKNDLFTGFTIGFTATGFTATNGDPVWPASGTWTFADATKKSVTRNDGTTVTLESISETELTLKLQWSKTTLGGGKINSIAGTHVFILNK